MWTHDYWTVGYKGVVLIPTYAYVYVNVLLGLKILLLGLKPILSSFTYRSRFFLLHVPTWFSQHYLVKNLGLLH